MNLVDKYDTLIGICALVSAIGMMLGTGIGVLGAGIWVFKKAISFKPKKES